LPLAHLGRGCRKWISGQDKKMNSRTRLNVRTGYADPDHRAECTGKRGSSEAPFAPTG
jgi:hypothetical protein